MVVPAAPSRRHTSVGAPRIFHDVPLSADEVRRAIGFADHPQLDFPFARLCEVSVEDLFDQFLEFWFGLHLGVRIQVERALKTPAMQGAQPLS